MLSMRQSENFPKFCCQDKILFLYFFTTAALNEAGNVSLENINLLHKQTHLYCLECCMIMLVLEGSKKTRSMINYIDNNS